MTDLISGCLYTKNGAGVTGLAVTYVAHKVERATNTATDAGNGSADEVGDGFYSCKIANANLKLYAYLVKFVTAGDVDEAELMGECTAVDPLASETPGDYPSGSAGHALGRIGRGVISVTAPVLENGDVITYQGAVYDADFGTALEWTDRDGVWPDLTGATIVTLIGDVAQFEGSVITPTGTGKKIRQELDGDDSESIPAGGPQGGRRLVQIWAEWETPEHKHPLVEAWWTSRMRVQGAPSA